MSKFLVITSISGGKDQLIDPPQKFDDCDYIAFVDKEYNCKIWEQRPIINFSFLDRFKDRRNAKPYKIMSSVMFQEYDYIVWCDGNHQLKKNPKEIIEEFNDDFDFLVFKHPDRTCTYQEMQAVAQWGMDDVQNVQSQLNYYKGVGMPDNFGLFEMSTFIKKNTMATKQFDLMWFEQICKFSSRDQISFPFVLWKMGDKLKYKILKGYSNKFTMKGDLGGNEYFEDQGRHLK
jgi:hypothetical protein